MMKSIIILIFLFCNFPISAQEYIPTLTNGNQWYLMKGLGMGSYTNNEYVIRCDTTINSNIYKKATPLNSTTALDFYREDIQNQKIYKWDQELQSEKLIIDYKLNIGDTMKMNSAILVVDSILVREHYDVDRKFIYFDDVQYYIEGIGFSLYGVHDFGGWQVITDFKETALDCNSTSTSVENVQSLAFYPNPTHGILKVTKKNDNKTNGIIVNELGQIVKAVHFNSEIDMTELPSGIYYLRVEEYNSIFKIVKI